MRILLHTIATLALATSAFSADEKPAAPASPTAVALSKIFAPTALAELKPLIKQKIIIEGKLVKLGANKTGSIQYLNFTEKYTESVSLVFFANQGGGTFTKEKLGEYVGKTVRVNGELTEYNGALQLKIESLDQLKIQPDPAPAPAQ